MNAPTVREEPEVQPEPFPSERIAIRVAYPADMFETMAALAARQRTSVQSLVRRAIRELLSEEER